MNKLDLEKITIRELNTKLQMSSSTETWLISNPKGAHALANMQELQAMVVLY